jgi:hypothetical protein
MPLLCTKQECETVHNIVQADGSLTFPHRISTAARQFVCNCLSLDPGNRPTAEHLLRDSPWLRNVSCADAL